MKYIIYLVVLIQNIMNIWGLSFTVEMIKFAKEHNIDRYNFYGITGDFSENAEDYGVQQFKKALMLVFMNILVTSLSQLNLFFIILNNGSKIEDNHCIISIL